MSWGVVQGAVAGGAAAFLHTSIERGGERAKACVALQVNHLLLLTAETLCAASVPLGAFGSLVRAVNILMPFAMIATLSDKTITAQEVQSATTWSHIYRGAVAAIAVASLILGNTAFGFGALGMLALSDLKLWSWEAPVDLVQGTCAALSVIGYSAQIFAATGGAALLAQISVVTTTLLFCFPELCRTSCSSSSSGSSSSRGWWGRSYDYYPSVTHHHYHHVPTTFRSSSWSSSSSRRPAPPVDSAPKTKSSGGAASLCRSSVW